MSHGQRRPRVDLECQRCRRGATQLAWAVRQCVLEIDSLAKKVARDIEDGVDATTIRQGRGVDGLPIHTDHQAGGVQGCHRCVSGEQVYLQAVDASRAQGGAVDSHRERGRAQDGALPGEFQSSEAQLVGERVTAGAGVVDPCGRDLDEGLQLVDDDGHLIGHLIAAAGHLEVHVGPIGVDEVRSGVAIFDHDGSRELWCRRRGGATRLRDDRDGRGLWPVHPRYRRREGEDRLLFGALGVGGCVDREPLQDGRKEGRNRRGRGLVAGEHGCKIAQEQLLSKSAPLLHWERGLSYREGQADPRTADQSCRDVDVEGHHGLIGRHCGQIHGGEQRASAVIDLDEAGAEVHRGVDESPEASGGEPGWHRNREALSVVGADQRDVVGQADGGPRERDVFAGDRVGVQRFGERRAGAAECHRQDDRRQQTRRRGGRSSNPASYPRRHAHSCSE